MTQGEKIETPGYFLVPSLVLSGGGGVAPDRTAPPPPRQRGRVLHPPPALDRLHHGGLLRSRRRTFLVTIIFTILICFCIISIIRGDSHFMGVWLFFSPQPCSSPAARRFYSRLLICLFTSHASATWSSALNMVATAQGIWMFIFPERGNTVNLPKKY